MREGCSRAGNVTWGNHAARVRLSFGERFFRSLTCDYAQMAVLMGPT